VFFFQKGTKKGTFQPFQVKNIRPPPCAGLGGQISGVLIQLSTANISMTCHRREMTIHRWIRRRRRKILRKKRWAPLNSVMQMHYLSNHTT